MFATNGTSFFVQAKYDGWREAVVTDVCFWHLASILTHALNGRYWVESRCGAVAVGRTYLLPPLSSGGALLVRP